MKLGKSAQTVLERRYLMRDERGDVVETVDGLFRRVAQAIAAPDANYDANADVAKTAETFYQMMTNLEFLPNSPTLMNAGRPLGQLSACFVLPVPDSMEEIFEAIKMAALIHKSGGGTGFSFSRLRPTGATVNSTGGVASGPISFMRVFNMATEAVKQGGTRRGANMGILRIDHPDILEFIDCKQKNGELTNFNLSVGVTEAFMNAALAGDNYDLIDPANHAVVGTLPARDVFEKIVYSAWKNGEPGIIFLDRLNKDNVIPTAGEIESTNPCGEQPLLPYESCNLGSINLVAMLDKKNGKYRINYDRLRTTVQNAVHFLDNVIDANKYPLDQIAETTRASRKIGLGVMGWADLLLRLGISYNSDEAVTLAEELMGFIRTEGWATSQELAKTRGTFPLFAESTLKDGPAMRNATITTIAPTGTLSIHAGCSSGVEPVFAYVFIRNIMDGTELVEVNPILRDVLEQRGLYSDELMRKIAEEGHISEIDELPEDIRRIFVSAHEVSPEYHIRMQAAFQTATDNAVSKTVNFCSDATEEDVAEVYRLAYQLGCKGVTIYRDGSRSEQVLNIGKVNHETEDSCKDCEFRKAAQTTIAPRSRPEVTSGITERVQIGCGKLYITVNYDEHGICEVFTNTGKHGGCPSQSEATARLTSLALRSGIDVASLVEQLRGIRCPSTLRVKGLRATSCPDAIAQVIERVSKSIGTNTPFSFVQDEPPVSDRQIRNCPECGALLEHEGSCVICRNCGYSKCG